MTDNYFIKSKIDLIEVLEDHERSILLDQMKTSILNKGHILFKEGDHPSEIYFIKEGKFKRHSKKQSDKEQVLSICSKGDLLGYHALLAEEIHKETVSALCSSEIIHINKDVFLELLLTSKSFSRLFYKKLSNEIDFLNINIKVMAQKSVRERLAFTLLLLYYEYQDSNKNGEVCIEISRKDLTSFVGTAKETLSRFLNEFIDEELVKISNGAIVLLDHSSLIKTAGI